MKQNQKQGPAKGTILVFVVLLSIVAIREGYTGNGKWYLLLLITLPLLLLAIIHNRYALRMEKKKYKKYNFNTTKIEGTMKKINNELVLTKDDYKLLITYLNGANVKTAFDPQNAADLQAELKKARLVDKDDLPVDVVRINSRVRVKAEEKDEIMEFILVTPDRADIKKKRISIMAPVGTALLGFRKGQQVKWQVPAGNRTFTILEVINKQ